MYEDSMLIFFADLILIVHVLFVLFVVFGLVAIYVGYFLKWSWVRNLLFRIIHLVATSVVVAQSWAGLICPLTTWEMALRERAGAEFYSGSCIQHWLQNLLYYNAPEWVFIAVYTGFGSLVLGSWFVAKPSRFGKK